MGKDDVLKGQEPSKTEDKRDNLMNRIRELGDEIAQKNEELEDLKRDLNDEQPEVDAEKTPKD